MLEEALCFTSNGHGFKTGDKILYTAGGTALNGLTNGTSYYAKVIDANTFSLASSFTNATESPETLLSLVEVMDVEILFPQFMLKPI